jgi:hypothetical protein
MDAKGVYFAGISSGALLALEEFHGRLGKAVR